MTNQEIIDEVMDNMDFDKIHRVMEYLNWQWADGEGGFEVPDVPRIRKFCRSLIKNLLEENLQSIESGGFLVYKDQYNSIRVLFTIETYTISND